MGNILDHLGVKYEVGIDEAAFYGPKLDIQYKNVFGKEDTLVTIQIDMLLAERFGMYYKDKDGQKKLPYIIHRTSLGCYERTLAYMIEHFGGAMPLWIAPEQVRLVPIADRHLDFAYEVKKELEAAGLRVEVDSRAEKVGWKIRQATMEKVPYMLTIGDKECEEKDRRSPQAQRRGSGQHERGRADGKSSPKRFAPSRSNCRRNRTACPVLPETEKSGYCGIRFLCSFVKNQHFPVDKVGGIRYNKNSRIFLGERENKENG